MTGSFVSWASPASPVPPCSGRPPCSGEWKVASCHQTRRRLHERFQLFPQNSVQTVKHQFLKTPILSTAQNITIALLKPWVSGGLGVGSELTQPPLCRLKQHLALGQWFLQCGQQLQRRPETLKTASQTPCQPRGIRNSGSGAQHCSGKPFREC